MMGRACPPCEGNYTMEAIDELLAKQAIREQLYRYCRSMDRRDDALGRTVFTEDCTMDYGQNFQGSGWEFVAWAHKAHDKAYEQTSHQITNMLIQLSKDGTKAISETYLHTLQLTHPNENGRAQELHIAARYLDRWVCLEGKWKIKARRYVQDIAELRQVQTPFPRFGGRPDPADPSYELLDWLE